jgi:hypothetical protein
LAELAKSLPTEQVAAPPLDTFAALLRTKRLAFANSRTPEQLKRHYDLLYAKGLLQAPPPPDPAAVIDAAYLAAAKASASSAEPEGSSDGQKNSQTGLGVPPGAEDDSASVKREEAAEAGAGAAAAAPESVLQSTTVKEEPTETPASRMVPAVSSAAPAHSGPSNGGVPPERMAIRVAARAAASAAAAISAHPPGSFDAVQERVLLDVALGKLQRK